MYSFELKAITQRTYDLPRSTQQPTVEFGLGYRPRLTYKLPRSRVPSTALAFKEQFEARAVRVIDAQSLGRDTQVPWPVHPPHPPEARKQWASSVSSRPSEGSHTPLTDECFTGHTLRRWRSAILRNEEHVSQSAEEPPNRDLEPLLDLSTITVSGTWKDLPQEIVDHILFMLRNDLESLKACSLTCKTMFVSTRPLIHRTIHLTWEQNWEVLTLRERQRYIRGDRQGIAVKVLSGIAAHGLLPYGRQLFIHLNKNFTPANLRPFNDHFQRLDRIQELTIYWLHTPSFLVQFDTFFANFVPTLRFLHLNTPTGDTRDTLDFICRFPHLDDLTLRMSSENPHDWRTWKSATLPVVKHIPPFRGRLKLCAINEWYGCILQQLMSLPGKRRFRFVDFRSCPSEVEQLVIDACSGTIETLSTTWKKYCGC